MTLRRDIGEANTVRQGFASAALEDGATAGKIPAVGSHGEMEFVENAGSLGGSSPVRHEVIPVAFTDVDETTGEAPLLTLQPGEWLFATWLVVSVAFNDTNIVPSSSVVVIPSGGTEVLSDSLTCTTISASNAVDGMIGPDPGTTPGGASVQTMMPIVSPATVAVPLALQFYAPLAGDGTTGQLDLHMLILNPP